MPIFLLVLPVFAGLLLFVFSACRVAAESDRQAEKMYHEYMKDRQVTDA